jgi:hypothetical protein
MFANEQIVADEPREAMTRESIRRHHIFRVVTFWVAVVCMMARVVVQRPDAAEGEEA